MSVYIDIILTYAIMGSKGLDDMAVTIRQIAEMAGVSTGTVDRALNNRGRVNHQVADRVKQIAKELDYHPNAIAKSLSIRRQNLRIAVISNVTGNQFVDIVFSGVRQAAEELRASGFSVDIMPCKDFDVSDQCRLIDNAIEKGYSGIVLIPLNDAAIRDRVNALNEKKFPVILLTSIIEGAEFLAYVGCNYKYSGQIACGILNQITHGDVCTGLMISNLHNWSNQQRLLHIQDYMKHKYPRIHIDHVLEMPNDDIYSYIKAKEFLHQHEDLQALIYCSGAVSGGLQAVIEHYEINPLTILCFDYTPAIRQALLDYKIPFTIAQNPKEQGYRALKLMSECFIDHKPMKNEYYYINTEIMVRESIKERN